MTAAVSSTTAAPVPQIPDGTLPIYLCSDKADARRDLVKMLKVADDHVRKIVNAGPTVAVCDCACFNGSGSGSAAPLLRQSKSGIDGGRSWTDVYDTLHSALRRLLAHVCNANDQSDWPPPHRGMAAAWQLTLTVFDLLADARQQKARYVEDLINAIPADDVVKNLTSFYKPLRQMCEQGRLLRKDHPLNLAGCISKVKPALFKLHDAEIKLLLAHAECPSPLEILTWNSPCLACCTAFAMQQKRLRVLYNRSYYEQGLDVVDCPKNFRTETGAEWSAVLHEPCWFGKDPKVRVHIMPMKGETSSTTGDPADEVDQDDDDSVAVSG